MEILRDLWGFLKERKKWWLLPMIVMLLLIGMLIFSSGSAVRKWKTYTGHVMTDSRHPDHDNSTR